MGKNVLVLGAGMISPPLLRYLLSRTDARVVVGALDVRRANEVLAEYSRGRALQLDVGDPAALEPLVAEADLVVSLLPASYNPQLARLAIARRIPLVNTSYVAPEMRDLDREARRAGVLLLCEVGLDPGLDHMSAVRLVRRVHALGGAVTRFSSCCGGFPAPDANNNPWGYKFSWFPRQVILSGRSPARYLRDGQAVEVPGPELFAHVWPYVVEGQGLFEVYPNRDSLAYLDAYQLGGVKTLLRGTVRHPGWCATLKAAADLGLLDVDEHDWPAGTTYADVVLRRVPPSDGALVERLAAHLGLDVDSEVLARFEWAGLLSDRRVPERRAAPLDVFVNRLWRLMTYRPGERDMIALEHRLEASFPDGHTEEITSGLMLTGEAWGDSAMARSVSLPAAVATRLILAGAIDATGVQIPLLPELYRPILLEIEGLGLTFHERRVTRYPGPLA